MVHKRFSLPEFSRRAVPGVNYFFPFVLQVKNVYIYNTIFFIAQGYTGIMYTTAWQVLNEFKDKTLIPE
jgi:hypothetical protein